MPGHITRLLWATISLKRLQYTRRSELIYSTKENVAGTKKKKKTIPNEARQTGGYSRGWRKYGLFIRGIGLFAIDRRENIK